MTLTVSTSAKRQVIDITKDIEEKLKGSGVVNVFVKHTTAAITTADLDPGTDQDYLEAISSLTPKVNWSHPHDPEHFPDHLWSTLIGAGVTLPYKNGKIILGTWQRVVLIELDGPRDRQIVVTCF